MLGRWSSFYWSVKGESKTLAPRHSPVSHVTQGSILSQLWSWCACALGFFLLFIVLTLHLSWRFIYSCRWDALTILGATSVIIRTYVSVWQVSHQETKHNHSHSLRVLTRSSYTDSNRRVHACRLQDLIFRYCTCANTLAAETTTQHTGTRIHPYPRSLLLLWSVFFGFF